MKLTAQSVARNGAQFLDKLMMREQVRGLTILGIQLTPVKGLPSVFVLRLFYSVSVVEKAV